MLKEKQPDIWVYPQEISSIAVKDLMGAHYVSYIEDITYMELTEMLGPPTFPKMSRDGLIYKEWVLWYAPRKLIISIHDCRTGSEQYTMLENIIWNVSAKHQSKKNIGDDLSNWAREFSGYVKYIQSVHKSCEQLSISLEN